MYADEVDYNEGKTVDTALNTAKDLFVRDSDFGDWNNINVEHVELNCKCKCVEDSKIMLTKNYFRNGDCYIDHDTKLVPLARRETEVAIQYGFVQAGH